MSAGAGWRTVVTSAHSWEDIITEEQANKAFGKPKESIPIS